MGQGEPFGGLGVGEKRGIEIQSHAALTGPINPILEVRRRQFVAFDAPPGGLGVNGVQVQPMLAGNEAKSLFQVGPQLIRVSGPAGMASGDRQASSQFGAGVFETAHVVALPTMDGDCHTGQPRNRLLRVHPVVGIAILGKFVRLLEGALWSSTWTRRCQQPNRCEFAAIATHAQAYHLGRCQPPR